jgi:hypothetical protein
MLGTAPTAHGGHYGDLVATRACGHTHHVGTCGCCQREALARAERQLAAAQAACTEWSRAS